MRPATTSRRSCATLTIVLALSGTLMLAGPPAVITAALPPLIAAAAGPADAYAGTWAQVTCTQPLAGLPPGPSEGWTPLLAGGVATNGCDPYNGGLIASLADTAAAFLGAGAGWQYTAPAGTTIAGGSIVFQLYAPQGLAYVTTGTISNAIASCQTGSPCGGTIGGSTGGLVRPIAPIGGTTIIATAACFTSGAGSCVANAGGSLLDAQVNVYQAIIELTSTATPAATGFAGGLLATGPITGTQPLTFVATDPGGPGVYRVLVAIDGNNVYQAIPDTNQGHCAPIGTDAGGYQEFLYATPCKASINFSTPVETALLADGNHALTVTVTDAAGNQSVVLQQQIKTANSTTVSAKIDGSVPPPPMSAVALSSSPPPPPVYAIALDPATQALAGGVQRRFSSSAVTVSGTLRNAAGVPAPAIPVALLAQNGDAGPSEAIVRTTSDGAGHWTLTAPPGPSRVLTITYGAQAQTATAGTGVAIKETVTPELSLNVRTLGGGRLRFSGHLNVSPLSTPRPIVIIEAGKAGHWQSVGEPVTVGANGHYRLNFTSSPSATGRPFQFRAVSAASNLFTAATSPINRKVVR